MIEPERKEKTETVKIKDMTSEQKRDLNRKQKQDSRDQKRGSNETIYLKTDADRRQKNRDKIQADSKSRVLAFRRSVRYGRLFECICCHRRLFENAVWKIHDEDAFKKEIDERFPGLFKKAINEIVTRKAP